jgi:hypothetical protein
MLKTNDPSKVEKIILLSASLIMLVIAFIQCFRTMHDLTWAYDRDFDRDMAFINDSLDGHFGLDPAYQGQYLWYNPLLFSLETMLVKLTGLPANIIVTRAGMYLDLLGPITFFLMVWRMVNLRVATAALLSYLFLAAGNIEGSGAATYSPWLYPVTFAQFFFYLDVLFCYKAFQTGKYSWFVLLGVSIGLTFLAHTAPAVIIILILILLQGANFLRAIKQKQNSAIGKYFLQGIAVFIPFLLINLPFLYYIIGKYHLNIVNKFIVDWRPTAMQWVNWKILVSHNLSFSLLIAAVGFVWVYRKFRSQPQRAIFVNWFLVTVVMYIYTTSIPGIRDKFHIQLPETVPNYHYFFYLKALQSVLYGFGLVFLLDLLLRRITVSKPALYIQLFAGAILLYAFVYYPWYCKRADFVDRRKLSLEKANKLYRVEMYDYLVHKVPDDKVILCPEQESTFPVLASGRKMVCVSILWSNPYVDFQKRLEDDSVMLHFVETGQPASARHLFDDYKVSYVFLPNDQAAPAAKATSLLGPPVMKDAQFTLFPVLR